MKNRGPRIHPRIVGGVTAAIAAAAVVMTFAQVSPPWAQPMHLRLDAGDFGEINPGAGVDLGGVHIGQVDNVDFHNGHAQLLLEIKPQYKNLIHADAAGSIRPYGLLGPKHVEIDGGQQGQIADNADIPLSRTSVSTDLQQVLNTLQPDVRQSLKVIFIELGTASDNRGGDMHAAIQDLGEAAADLSTVTGVVRGRDADVAGIIDSSETFNADVQYAPIAQQIADTNEVLTALVKVENNLGDGIDQTAAVLIEVHQIMQGNEQNLAYVLSKAPGTVKQLEQLMKTEGQLVQDLSFTLPQLMTAVMETKSAFSATDNKGQHYVRVEAISGPCTSGGSNASCAGKPGGPHGNSNPNGSSGSSPSGSSDITRGGSGAPPKASTSDMISFLLGG